MFVCTVQTSTGKFMGVIGLVMGADLRDYQHLCFRGRTGVRGSSGVGANGCSANRCSGEATATLMAVVMANVWRIFADLFGGCVGFPPPSSLE